VAAAAEEAGISRQYVALALAELPRGTLPTAAGGGAGERRATLFLGTADRSLSASLVVPASPRGRCAPSARCSSRRPTSSSCGRPWARTRSTAA
jgi:hypothetical protein